MNDPSLLKGLLSSPLPNPDGSPYRGRFTFHDLRWIENKDRVEAACATSLRQLADAIESDLLWTDQEVQRGIKPGITPPPPVELSLKNGYPDTKKYEFKATNADDIVEKILKGDRLHLSPLIWNIRPGTFEAYWSKEERGLFFYRGRIYLPDSHHRHQALYKAYKTFSEAPADYPKFDPHQQFSLQIHFMSRSEEGDFFYEKNQLPTPVAKSKAYDLTTQDSLSVLTKSFIEHTPSLQGNVNRVTDRLTAKNPQVVTLSTLRAMAEAVVGDDHIPQEQIEETAKHMARFYEILVSIRPELGILTEGQRTEVRERLLVDSAVMFHGYAVLMNAFSKEARSSTLDKAANHWKTLLAPLGKDYSHSRPKYRGDYFDRTNPVWKSTGILQTTKSGGEAVSNTRQTREVCGKSLKELIGIT